MFFSKILGRGAMILWKFQRASFCILLNFCKKNWTFSDRVLFYTPPTSPHPTPPQHIYITTTPLVCIRKSYPKFEIFIFIFIGLEKMFEQKTLHFLTLHFFSSTFCLNPLKREKLFDPQKLDFLLLAYSYYYLFLLTHCFLYKDIHRGQGWYGGFKKDLHKIFFKKLFNGMSRLQNNNNCPIQHLFTLNVAWPPVGIF